jgi:hypothetical protein
MIVAGVLLLAGFAPSDATAQPRPVPGNKKPIVTQPIQNFSQVQYPSIQMTINNFWMNEWSRRAANIPVLRPIVIVQQPPFYPYGYMNGYYPPAVINPYLR